MKKKLNEIQVWQLLGHWFSFYSRTGRHIRFRHRTRLRLFYNVTDCGLCKSLSCLAELEIMEFEIYCKVSSKIWHEIHEKPHLYYLFPIDREGAIERVEFCKEQVRLLEDCKKRWPINYDKEEYKKAIARLPVLP